MDLAEMIADISVGKFKEECDKNVCVVNINLHNRYRYEITVTPMATHVLIKYMTLSYKIPRTDKDAYLDTIDFLVEALDEECYSAMNEDIEFNGYWPESDEEHYFCSLRVKRHDKQVFYSEFKRDNMQKEVKRYMRTLRLLN